MKTLTHYLSPLLLSLFILPLYANAEDVATTSTTSIATSSVVLTKAQLFTTCSQDAIETRDTKLAQARGSYNTAMNILLVERKEQEKDAVAIEDEKEKKEAIKESVDNYKTQVKTIQNTLTLSRKTIWQNFENDTKACREILEKKDDEDNKNLKRGMPANEVSKKEAAEPAAMMMEVRKEAVIEQKSVKESFFESIKSLFSKE